MKRIVLAVAVFAAGLESDAHAIASCMGSASWAIGDISLPPNGHLVFWTDRNVDGETPELVATIAGKRVPTHIRVLDSKPYRFVIVDIGSSAIGKLALTWKGTGIFGYESGEFAVLRRPTTKPFKKATAKVGRFHEEMRHSTVKETYLGIEITLDVPAVMAHVKVRRDKDSTWAELDVPVNNHALRIGQLGCKSNYSLGLLRNGIDVEITATLADGTTVPVEGLSRIKLT